MRRVVVGHKNGKSVFVDDGSPARSHVYQHAAGMESAFTWTTPPKAVLSAADRAESVTTESPVIPALGGTSLIFLTIPPDSWAGREGYDPAAAVGEMAEHQPDIVATFEPQSPGFHRTDSIDYVIVLDGEIHLEIDDGQEVRLVEHDVVIQGGTRHAWRNRSDKPAVLAVVLVGAERDID